MSNTSGIISKPVDLMGDVCKVLAIPRSSGVAYACSNKHGRINPYAKFKPVPYAGPVIANRASTYWYRGSKFYSAQQPCGIAVKKLANSTGTITAANLATGTNWKQSYNPPVPGTDWCRLLDFDGYNHAEPLPFSCTYPQGTTLYVGDGMSGDSLKCAFMGDFTGTPLQSSHICALDISQAFMYDLPAGSLGCVGFIAVVPSGTMFVKSVSCTTAMAYPLVDLNISETKEQAIWNYAVGKGTTTLYPVFCNREVATWTRVADAGTEFEVILFPTEFSGWKKAVSYAQLTTPVLIDYTVNIYKYGSNFTEPFVPLLNGVPYNGESSYLDVEMEVVLADTGSVNIYPMVGYEFTTVNGYHFVDDNPDYANSSGWTTATVNGTRRDVLRYPRYRLRGMYYRNSSGQTASATGTVAVTWRPKGDFSVSGSFYFYCEG